MPVYIQPIERRRWQRLLVEAIARGLTTVERGPAPPPIGTARATVFVSSYSDPELAHEVFVRRSGDGTVVATCDCHAAEFGTACTHIAVATDRVGLWPTGMVIARQTALPDASVRHEFHIGEWAQVVGTDRTGVIDAIRVSEARPEYRVVDPYAHALLGHFHSYELSPATKPEHTPKVDPAIGLALIGAKGGAAS